MDRVRDLLEKSPPHISGKIINNHIILDIVEPEVHYWSPHLDFRVEEDEFNENQSIVSGLIGPRPAVWTLFMFIYFSVGILGFFISSYGVSQWVVGRFSWTLLAFPVAVVFMLTAYAAGKQGEKLGADQIEILKQFIRDSILNEASSQKASDS
ncbi:hypothetical protein KFE98_01125 [bacterium SCSIO 12741]|nr:hypothetical protein KFE98_01125 [bacterium SCSIO 12741]